MSEATSEIVNGELDGDGHPNVGSLVALFADGPRALCSGSLISETAFLTAAHCIDRLEEFGIADVAGVTFSPQFIPGESKMYLGIPTRHPQYAYDSSHPEIAPLNDVAIIVLQEPVVGIKPVKIAKANLLEKIKPAKLYEATFVTVGYGTTDENFWMRRGTRYSATERFIALIGEEAGLSENRLAALGGSFEEGYGTACGGDSGGPHFYKDVVVGTTTYVWCGWSPEGTWGYAYNWATRIDVAPVRNFIAQYLRPDDD